MSNILAPRTTTPVPPATQYVADKNNLLRKKIQRLRADYLGEYADFWNITLTNVVIGQDPATGAPRVGNLPPRHASLTPGAKLAAHGPDAMGYLLIGAETAMMISLLDPQGFVGTPVPTDPPAPAFANTRFVPSPSVCLGALLAMESAQKTVTAAGANVTADQTAALTAAQAAYATAYGDGTVILQQSSVAPDGNTVIWTTLS